MGCTWCGRRDVTHKTCVGKMRSDTADSDNLLHNGHQFENRLPGATVFRGRIGTAQRWLVQYCLVVVHLLRTKTYFLGIIYYERDFSDIFKYQMSLIYKIYKHTSLMTAGTSQQLHFKSSTWESRATKLPHHFSQRKKIHPSVRKLNV